MSPPRTPYRPGRARRETVQAVIGVLTVVIVTAVLIWVFAPDTGNGGSTPPFTLPADMSSTTTAPGGAVTTVPTTTATTAPPG